MILGVDPGAGGALVLLANDGRCVDHLLMPTLKVGTKTRVNGAAIAAWVRQGLERYPEPWHAFLERVGSMPKQGVASMFSFGHAAGLVEGVISGANIPITLVAPAQWKRGSQLIGTEKDAARSRAIQLYPDQRVLDTIGKGQAVADALLIARHGLSLAPNG